jgi:hypothetical protein
LSSASNGILAAPTGDGDDVAAGVPGELDSDPADGARPVDQYTLSSSDARVLEHCLPRGDPGDGDGCGVGQRDAGRGRDERLRRGDRVIRGGTAVEPPDHPFSDRCGSNPWADLHDRAGNVIAEGVWQVHGEH